MPALKPFNQILGRLFETLSKIEGMGADPPGIAVNDDPVAPTFACQTGNGLFEPLADAFATAVLVDNEITDLGEGLANADHGYKMQRDETFHRRTIPNE